MGAVIGGKEVRAGKIIPLVKKKEMYCGAGRLSPLLQ